jgi:hypothetical protein
LRRTKLIGNTIGITIGIIAVGAAVVRADGILNAPVGVLRGDLIDWQGEKNAGDLNVRTPDAHLYTCHFDAFTYIERDNQRIGMAVINSGDRLEIIADHKPGATSCYARTIRVMDNRPQVTNPGYRINLRPFRSTTELLYPRGNLTFSGVVLRLNSGMIVLNTRADGEKTILIRQDTRFLDGGMPSSLSTLPVNTRVFVRGGRNFDDELEAFQVIWGEIPGPKSY